MLKLTSSKALNHQATENAQANEAAYKKWVESFSPDEIRVANNARIQLKKLDSADASSRTKQHRYTRIKDHRAPARPRSAYSLFLQERHASGDFKGISITDAATQVSREFKDLSISDKKV